MTEYVDEYKFKVVLLGDGKVGKTSLVRKFVKNVFDEKYLATLGTNVYLKELDIKQGSDMYKVTLSIWDVLGQKAYQHVIKGALKGTRGVIYVCDLTNRESLLNLKEWIWTVYQNLDRSVFIFFGNKADLKKKEFGISELNETASVFNSPALLTSAKTGENVEVGFQSLGTRILNEMFCPLEAQVELPEFSPNIDPITQATDQIMDLFCEELGGYERVMPVTRIVFKNLGIDFKDPSKEDLLRLIDQLMDITSDEKGATVAKQLGEKMKETLPK
jgi:small GTP-binding protein